MAEQDLGVSLRKFRLQGDVPHILAVSSIRSLLSVSRRFLADGQVGSPLEMRVSAKTLRGEDFHRRDCDSEPHEHPLLHQSSEGTVADTHAKTMPRTGSVPEFGAALAPIGKQRPSLAQFARNCVFNVGSKLTRFGQMWAKFRPTLTIKFGPMSATSGQIWSMFDRDVNLLGPSRRNIGQFGQTNGQDSADFA